jgi:hypothetical protein
VWEHVVCSLEKNHRKLSDACRVRTPVKMASRMGSIRCSRQSISWGAISGIQPKSWHFKLDATLTEDRLRALWKMSHVACEAPKSWFHLYRPHQSNKACCWTTQMRHAWACSRSSHVVTCDYVRAHVV